MAEMIPARLKKTASKGEQRVSRLLEMLPDDCLVYYEPRVCDRCPDFILIHPRLGVLILEVKGWFPASILDANSYSVRIEWNGQERTAPHPLRQAREYMNRTLNAFRSSQGSLFANPILHLDGAYMGYPIFPVGHAVIFSNITRQQWDKKDPALLDAVFPPAQTVYRDELDHLGSADAKVLELRLRRMFTEKFAFPPLTEGQVDVIRGILHPQILFRKGSLSTPPVSRETFAPVPADPSSTPPRSRPETPAGSPSATRGGIRSYDPEPRLAETEGYAAEAEPVAYQSPKTDARTEVKDEEPAGEFPRDPSVPVPVTYEQVQFYVLDKRQEKHARALGDGHRLLFGVAGSGKTVILLARARELARKDPDARILVLCYNISLAAYLRHALAGYPSVTVHHFDGWAKSSDVSRYPNESDDSFGKRFLARISSGLRDSARFDAVLVDEAQDFDPTWFKVILMGMKDPVDGDLLIVGDGHQSIRTTRKIVWKDLGIQASGRTVSARFGLDRNYRNSREIIAFANPLLHEEAEESFQNPDGVAAVPLDLSLVQRSTGHAPRLIRSPSRQAQCDAAFEVITDLLAGRWNGKPLPAALFPEEIGVLYPCIENDADRLSLETFRRRLTESGIPLHWLTENQEAKTQVCDPTLKVQTIHSAKGLQYRAVILLWADILPRHYVEQSEAEERALLYVALTRAEEFLSVHYSRPSTFLRILADGRDAPV